MKRDRLQLITIWATLCAALLVLGATYDRYALRHWPDALAFTVIAAVSERLSIQISAEVTSSVTLPVLYAAGIILGPFVGGFVAFVTPMALNPQARRWTWRGFVFNHAQLTLAITLGTLVYTATRSSPGSFGSRDILAMALGAVVAWLINEGSVSLIIAVGSGRPIWDTFDYYLKETTADYIALSTMAILMAAVFASVGWIGLVLFFLPLLVARHAVAMYAEMKKAYTDTIASLSAALEARDAYTAGHSRRVAEVAVRIGNELGMSESDLETLRYAGLLHDIGKIGIEDRLLKKPARFSPEEYDEVQIHAQITSTILDGVAGFEKVRDWASHHHERYDGSGYPDGLEGERIPLGARVLAVADAFDAMASRRVYKPSMPFEQVLDELMSHRGTQFDPRVLDAFVRVMEEPGFREWLQSELPYFAMPEPREIVAMVQARLVAGEDAGGRREGDGGAGNRPGAEHC